MTIEHGHANHLADDWSSTAYWYQLLPTAPALTIRPVEERLPVVPQLPTRPYSNVELTEEQQAARQNYAQREEAYFPKREEQFRIKEEKCRR